MGTRHPNVLAAFTQHAAFEAAALNEEGDKAPRAAARPRSSR